MSRHHHIPLLPALAFLLVLPGCADDVGPTMSAQVESLCVIQPAEEVVAQGGAFSLDFGETTLWVYGETWLESANADGDTIIPNAYALSSESPAECAGSLQVGRDETGGLTPLIPLRADEAELNASNPDGERIALWPTSGYVHEGVGWVFYRKVRFAGDYFDVTDLGVGVARVALGEPTERIEVDAADTDATDLLWEWPQTDWGASAIAVDDTAYVYGCRALSFWEQSCRVARVAADQPYDLAGYTYFSGDSWSPNADDSVVVMSGMTGFSIAWNDHLERFTAVFPTWFTNEVVVRTSVTPEGPFDRPRTLFVADDGPDEWFIRDIAQHPAYAEDGGATVLITYYSEPLDGPSGMRVARVTLED